MIEILKKVKFAVARRDLIPLQTCFHFYGDRVQGYNGSVCIDAPFTFFEGSELTIHADKFLRAAKLTKGVFKWRITEKQKLSISKHKFRAMLPLSEHERFPRLERGEADQYSATGLMRVFRELRPFVSEDASRPWSRSVKLLKGFAYATNNVVIARLPAPAIPETVIPVLAIDIINEMDMEPESVEVSDTFVVFNFPDGMWLRCNLMNLKWPNIEGIIKETELDDLPMYFAETIENLLPFCDDPKHPMIKLGEYGVSTSEGTSEATMDIGDFPECIFRAEPLLAVAKRSHGIAFSSYPDPCYFEGDGNLCGVLLGLMS